MRTFLVYTLLRLAIFAACFGILYLLFGSETSPWLVALPALLFTSGLSWLLLRRQGVEAGRALSGGIRSVRGRIDAATRKEDID
ncbi:DUF4229 domain-containing protein [Actinopolymorpha sp. B17G11]|uniref:DUF4229 domain-containing protein n=1 Tax=unclassified Actinopolymorpha TaxID=2627063 RepID=UPI0032D94ED9